MIFRIAGSKAKNGITSAQALRQAGAMEAYFASRTFGSGPIFPRMHPVRRRPDQRWRRCKSRADRRYEPGQKTIRGIVFPTIGLRSSFRWPLLGHASMPCQATGNGLPANHERHHRKPEFCALVLGHPFTGKTAPRTVFWPGSPQNLAKAVPKADQVQLVAEIAASRFARTRFPILLFPSKPDPPW